MSVEAPDPQTIIDNQVKALANQAQIINKLSTENQIFRNALQELEVEKATLSHTFLGTSLKIRMLLQPSTEQ